MVICKAKILSDFRPPYTVVLNEAQDWPGQKRYWVVVRNERSKKVLVYKSTWSEKMARQIWMEECSFLLDTNANLQSVREKQRAEIETLSSAAE